MNGAYYRLKADRCRSLLEVAIVPEVREQLQVWQCEFDCLADAAERRAAREKRLRPWQDRLRQKRGLAVG